MKKLLIYTCVLFGSAQMVAQITPSVSFDGIANYDGSYDKFGQNHLWYPNGGEIRLSDEEQSSTIDFVKYYTMNTHPKQFLLNNNNMTLGFAKKSTGSTPDSLQRIDLEWLSSNSAATLARVDTQNFARLYYMNQYFANVGGRTVDGGAAIACQSLYNNIDLVYTSNNAGLVMYLVVYPGGNYKDIKLHFNGANSTGIISNKLKAGGSWDNFTLQKPQMYQYVVSGSTVTPVTVCNASWVNTGTDTYGITNSTSYNTALPLIIQLRQNTAVANIDEPGLCWSTYFGGWQQEELERTHVDANNNLYIAGNTTSGNYPQNQGIQSAQIVAVEGAITKFSAQGIIQWSAFVGGNGNDDIRDFDFSGNSIYCVGRTQGLTTVPKTGAYLDNSFGTGAPFDGFVWQFQLGSNNQFNTSWLTYFGGSGYEDIHACKIDAGGNLYMVGASTSSNMTVTGPSGAYVKNFNPAQLNPAPNSIACTDAIIAKFAYTGNLDWFTFFGTDSLGTNAFTHAGDYFYGLDVTANDVYACGKAGGTNMPGRVNNKFAANQFDGIVVNFSTYGDLVSSKFTDGNIANYSVKELWSEVYTAGIADTSMATKNSAFWYFNAASSGSTDACFSVHSPTLNPNTIHCTFIDGSNEDAAYDIDFTKNNLLIVTGGTKSSNFPTTSIGSMYKKSFAGGITDNFICAFQKGDTLMTWGTCLGSNMGNESMTFPDYINSQFDMGISTISVDNNNVLRLLGYSTSYNTFPLDNGNGIPYFQNLTGGGFNDGTITCFDMADLTAIVGIKDFPKTSFVFGLYPNPAEEYLEINNSSISKQDLIYAIYDASGKKVSSGTLKSGSERRVFVQGLASGLYVINISDGKTTYSNKFIKSN